MSPPGRVKCTHPPGRDNESALIALTVRRRAKPSCLTAKQLAERWRVYRPRPTYRQADLSRENPAAVRQTMQLFSVRMNPGPR